MVEFYFFYLYNSKTAHDWLSSKAYWKSACDIFTVCSQYLTDLYNISK